VTLQQREIQHIGEAIAGAHMGVSPMCDPRDTARYIVGALSPIFADHCPGFDRDAFRAAAQVSDGHTQEQLERIGAMAGFMDVQLPDSGNSTSAKWLEYLADSIQLAWDREEFDLESRDRDSEIIDVIAGNSVPVEQGFCWMIFTDLEIFQNYDAGDGYPEMGNDPSKWCAGVLEWIAREGLNAWIQEALSSLEECSDCNTRMDRDNHCPQCDDV
jgi:hypothetical protein